MKKKLLFNLLLILCLSTIIATPILAANEYLPSMGNPGEATKIKSAGASILVIISAIGASVAAVILVWLAIKYIAAAPEEKAVIKKTAVNYIIGCIVLFAASGILALIASIAGQVDKDLGAPKTLQEEFEELPRDEIGA